DGSTDDTAGAAREAGARVVRHENNRGAASARNTGIEATHQPWIAPLDSDDRWLPHMLSTLWPLRDDFRLVSRASGSVDSACRPKACGGAVEGKPILLTSPAQLVFPENFISASGVVVHRDTFCAAGHYRTNLPFAEDFDLWIRMLQQRPGLCIPTVVTM